MSTLPVALGLVAGAAVDELVGDPRRGHPVAGFGRLAAATEQRMYADDVVRGAWYAATLTLPLLAISAALERAVRGRTVTHAAVVAVATWCVLGGTSLGRTGDRMAGLLDAQQTDAARELLPSLCGRDPADLDPDGLARATVESVAENTSDAVVAPLVWGAIAGVPGLLGYRALNTLDAMVGHRSPRYARFGTASARLDDLVNLVPARLTAVLTLVAAPVVQGSVRGGWTAWRRDARRHPSPNAGHCEATAAGVLGVRLGGVTVYGGRVETRPELGSGAAPRIADISRAVTLSRAVQHLALATCVAVVLLRRSLGGRP